MTVTMSSTMSARAQSEERKANNFLIKSSTMSDRNTKQGTSYHFYRGLKLSEDSNLGVS